MIGENAVQDMPLGLDEYTNEVKNNNIINTDIFRHKNIEIQDGDYLLPRKYKRVKQ